MERELPQVGDGNTLSRKAWTAYASIMVYWVLLMAAVAATAWVFGYYSLIPLLIGSAFLGYQWAWLKSLELYYDENGVWVYRGILPWKRGSFGMKWRDIEIASFKQNLTSWTTHSYSLQILDRYTRKPELVLTDMRHGDQAVMFINNRLNEMIRDHRLVG
jgi:hypothetical protein